MRAKGLVCPGLGSIFRPPTAPPSDAAVLDVARAIYHKGRPEGSPGLLAVAHVIQNRCRHPHFPGEPLAVVRAEAGQFPLGRQAGPVLDSPSERQLFALAVRYASQLVHPPRRLPCADPTGGSLHYEPRGAAAGPPGGRVHDAEQSAEEDVGAHEPPRHVPRTSRRPRSFFRRRSPDGEGETARGDCPGGRRAERGGGGGVPAGAVQRGRPGFPGGAAQPPIGEAGAVPSASSVPFHAAPPSRAPMRGAAGPTVGDWAVSQASPAGLAASPLGPPPGPAPLSLGARPLTRPMCAAAGRPGGEPRPMLRGPQRVPHGGPAGLYHDMLLPCGLFQEEAIDIMFRELSPDDFEMLAKLDEHLPKRNIVQRTTVDTLPQHHAQDCDVTECGVCLVALEPTTRVSALPCGHAFHPHCIARWLTECKNACPLCSAKICQDGATPSGDSRLDATPSASGASSSSAGGSPEVGRSSPGGGGGPFAASPSGVRAVSRPGAAAPSSASTPYLGPLCI